MKLTLTGTVTDEPIANAVVTATVGDETFTTTADENGNYSLEIEIDEADANNFVTLTAQGAGERSFVQFVSLAGSFAALLEQAGDDGILSPDENFATQITNVSTAEAVLMQAANDGQPITTDATLASLGATLSAESVLNLATAIKLAVDRPEEYPLPEGSDSLMDVLGDINLLRFLVATAFARDSEAFEEARTAIATDPALLRPVSADALAPSLTAAFMRHSPEAAFQHATIDRVTAFTFEADGTGRVVTRMNDRTMTWTVEGSTIQVLYDEPVELFGTELEVCDGIEQGVNAKYSTRGLVLSLLGARTLATTELVTVSVPECPTLPERETTFTFARTILRDDDFQVIDSADIAGARHTIQVYDPTQDPGQDMIAADIAEFLPDGTGSTVLFGRSFTWEQDPDGRAIVVSFDDGSTGRFRVLRKTDALTSDVLFEISAGNRRFVDAGPSVHLDPELAVELEEADVPGRYYLFGIGEELAPHPQLKGLRLRFVPGGVGAIEIDSLDVNGGVILSESPFRWQLSAGEIRIQRTRDPISNLQGCEPGIGNCIVWDIRRYVPLAMDGTRVYVIEERYVDFEGTGITDETPRYYQVVRYYDYEPLEAGLTN